MAETSAPPQGSGAGAGRGRPALPLERRRSYRLVVRLTASELAVVHKKALKAEAPLAEFVRSVLLNARPRPAVVPRIHLEAVGELKRVGNNLNQIAVAIHSNRAPLGWLRTTRELRDWLARVEAQLLGAPSRGGES